MATAATRQTISWYRTTTPATVIFAPAPKNISTMWASSGFQTHCARYTVPRSTATVTMIFVTSAVPRRPRMTAACSAAPIAGPTRPTTMISASHTGQPHRTVKCQ